jgi:hypothetical protein
VAETNTGDLIMATTITFSDAAREAMLDNDDLNSVIIGGSGASNPTFNAYTSGDTLLFSVDLDTTAAIVYTSGGSAVLTRPSGVFTGLAPEGVATGNIAKWDVKDLSGTAHISGTAGLTGSDNSWTLGNLAVTNGVAIPVAFSAEPTITIPNP